MSWQPPSITIGRATHTVPAGATVTLGLDVDDPTTDQSPAGDQLPALQRAALRWGQAGVINGDR